MLDSDSEGSTTTIRPAERAGEALVGRDDAAELRHEVERRLGRGEHVVLDFAGTAAVSPSFADELLAKLPAGALADGRVVVEHLDTGQQALARMVTAARHSRLPQPPESDSAP